LRILGVADIHNSQLKVKAINRIISEYSPDIVIVAGDITTFGPSEAVKTILDSIEAKTLLAIPGNADPIDSVKYIEKSHAINIHLNPIKISGFEFVGFGGSPETPFGTPFELSEDEIKKMLSEVVIKENTILVTHAPPYGILDKTATGFHAGSKAIRDIIEASPPYVHIFGHIHEALGFEKIGKTTFVNVSIGRFRKFFLIEIDEQEKAVNIIKIEKEEF